MLQSVELPIPSTVAVSCSCSVLLADQCTFALLYDRRFVVNTGCSYLTLFKL